jgi:hypothetical protein
VNEAHNWLISKGYILNEFGEYEYNYRNGNYAARNIFTIYDTVSISVDALKTVHEKFMTRAESKDIL